MQDLKGKIQLDFKDPKALRALTRCSLKKYFNLDVEIPPDRLVPTLPLRLNVLLWIQDVLRAAEIVTEGVSQKVVGLDVGCGANCVFPLVGVRHFDWDFVATEADEEAVACARRNVTANGLDDRIKG
jgi:methyltransferase